MIMSACFELSGKSRKPSSNNKMSQKLVNKIKETNKRLGKKNCIVLVFTPGRVVATRRKIHIIIKIMNEVNKKDIITISMFVVRGFEPWMTGTVARAILHVSKSLRAYYNWT